MYLPDGRQELEIENWKLYISIIPPPTASWQILGSVNKSKLSEFDSDSESNSGLSTPHY